MNNHFIYLIITLIACMAMTGCAAKYEVIPQMKNLEFTVTEKFGELMYKSMADARGPLDRTGKVESDCSGGKSGIIHLGDKSYKVPLIFVFDSSLKNSLEDSNLFSIVSAQISEDTYVFSSSLDQFHVLIDQVNAQQTAACVGYLAASFVDVTATTDVKITAKLSKDNKEIWRQTIIKQAITRDNSSKSKRNAENCIGQAIGEACNEVINTLALYLSSESAQ